MDNTIWRSENDDPLLACDTSLEKLSGRMYVRGMVGASWAEKGTVQPF